MTKQAAWNCLEYYVRMFSQNGIPGAMTSAFKALDTLKPSPEEEPNSDDLPACDLRAAWLKIVELERREAKLIDRMDYLEGLFQEHSHQRIKPEFVPPGAYEQSR
jgi:hypothetical protein